MSIQRKGSYCMSNEEHRQEMENQYVIEAKKPHHLWDMSAEASVHTATFQANEYSDICWSETKPLTDYSTKEANTKIHI